MELERIEIITRAAWREWLAQHHDDSAGVWVVTYKKAFDGYVPYEDLVLEALCFGWVDSRTKGVDEQRTSITMTPRRPQSRWTQPNRDRVAALEAAGLMAEPGLAAVARARESGSWDELRPVEALEEPADLAAALDANPAARGGWESWTRSARYAELLRLFDSKRAETRRRRIDDIVDRARG